MFQSEHRSGFAIVRTKCSNWNITAVLPEHCGNLGKLGKPRTPTSPSGTSNRRVVPHTLQSIELKPRSLRFCIAASLIGVAQSGSRSEEHTSELQSLRH